MGDLYNPAGHGEGCDDCDGIPDGIMDELFDIFTFDASSGPAVGETEADHESEEPIQAQAPGQERQGQPRVALNIDLRGMAPARGLSWIQSGSALLE